MVLTKTFVPMCVCVDNVIKIAILFIFLSFSFALSHLDPPSAPIITGYVEGSIIPAGTITKLLCVSTGGNPLATLTWYKNDKKVCKTNLIGSFFDPTI